MSLCYANHEQIVNKKFTEILMELFILLVSFFLDGDFDIWVLPWGWGFAIAKTCFGRKAVPRSGNLTFSRCLGVGNLTLALVKMSNSPGSTRPASTLELNIDRCISQSTSFDLAIFSEGYSTKWPFFLRGSKKLALYLRGVLCRHFDLLFLRG